MHSPISAVPLDKAPKDTITTTGQAHGLNVTPEELESLRQAFRIFDVRGAGTITLTDFGKIIENLNIATDTAEIQSIAHAVDLNNDNLIDFEEFATAMIRHLTPDGTLVTSSSKQPVVAFTEEPQSYHHPSMESALKSSTPSNFSKRTKNGSKRISFYDDMELVQCFQAFDKNRDGLISKKELEDVMISLGEHLTLHEIKAMMDDADTNGDGFIDFDEFKNLLPK
ncbi:hypothetical protein BDB00DRAFT_62262 [Zychaea mexicana]|uniref:uncharacterized protein n=1 Tax=Zychaea mexicana TaxID=64656 RepID=UPI0022FEC8A9|nr:uncharacterized protein BDB00DRAFT_62262 [Zychaea mexicana]KAI9488166.1 hypothetical protein BDB00DRAFT_62262 [Zychaea mexicana]